MTESEDVLLAEIRAFADRFGATEDPHADRGDDPARAEAARSFTARLEFEMTAWLAQDGHGEYWVDGVVLSEVRRPSADSAELRGHAWIALGRDMWLEPLRATACWQSEVTAQRGFAIRIGDRDVGLRGVSDKRLGTYWPTRGVFEIHRH